MTIKSSISLRDEQHAFAKELVAAGQYASLSAVIQQGLDLLRQREMDARADRLALKTLLEERMAGKFVSGSDLRAQLAARRSTHRS
ncbi:ribbon-helix-helix domain-containing protein [Paracoccus laeviglucosivorans]|uniref:Antitoxin ParD1/3/4 n=1 Tax=Paracoccus laeviglucosivorans TaxID=1197861 RepID=A0A521FRM2_9RHOB|nr:type II toxin-antitoxin system ParD family antitoxin [Paracoccus laeviglucosivorans]SMO98848.1 antitoxin ParD1/3/4 [Paracoccus laeviglucosivorans]